MNQRAKRHMLDHDFVPPDPSKPVKPGTKLPPHYLELEKYPSEFNAINLNTRSGRPKLPATKFPMSEVDALCLYLDEEIIQMMVDETNRNASRSRAEHELGKIQNNMYLPNQRPWKDVSNVEMYRWIGIFIYIGNHKESQLKNYWKCSGRGPIHFDVVASMSQVRWEQINRYLHVCDKEDMAQSMSQNSTKKRPISTVRPHDKVEPIAKRLKTNFQKYWTPGTHVTVDECIAGFSGKSSDIVNIPTKPTPIGYKIWVLSDSGYVYDFLFHRRGSKQGQGPQGLSQELVDSLPRLKISPTQAVVLELMSRMPDKGKNYCVWLDNLFTSKNLLQELRKRGSGAAGTVRMSVTRREQVIEMVDGDVPDLPGNPIVSMEEEHSMSQSIDPELSLDGDTQVSEPVEIDRSEAINTNLSTTTSKSNNFTKSRDISNLKEAANGMHPDLLALKRSFNKTLDWGRFFAVTVDDGNVLQFAWRDGSVVLFMSTVAADSQEVIRLRKRPSSTSKQLRGAFGDEVLKNLPIPGLIDMYNHNMNGVDLADQMRASYSMKHRTHRTWVPLFRYLIETTVSNASKLWLSINNQSTKRSGRYHFREACAYGFMAYGSETRIVPQAMIDKIEQCLSRAKRDSPQVTPVQHSMTSGCQGEHKVLSQNVRSCAVCLRDGRKAAGTARKPLSELNSNSLRGIAEFRRARKNTPRTRYGCSICKIFICNVARCWSSHVN
jgi:Transposase IS4